MDRFALHFGLRCIGEEAEAALLDDQRSGHPLTRLVLWATAEECLQLRRAVQQARVSEPIPRRSAQSGVAQDAPAAAADQAQAPAAGAPSASPAAIRSRCRTPAGARPWG
jgi:hypothetical protein